MTPQEIVAIARETVGTPYGHQGRFAGLALDCAGVPAHVAKRLGRDFQPIADYGRIPNPHEIRSIMDAHLIKVPKREMQIGDVVWLCIREEPRHLGILGDYFAGGFSLIHANNVGVNKIVEHRLDDVWLRRIVAVWRFQEVTQ